MSGSKQFLSTENIGSTYLTPRYKQIYVATKFIFIKNFDQEM